jgi:hypothetical protein
MRGLADHVWDRLLRRIKDGKCTPIVGRDVCSADPPVGCDPSKWNFQYPLDPGLSRRWAQQVRYPFADADNLERVAQFVAIRRDQAAAKEYIERLLARARPPDFSCENEPHRVLAELPFPIYLTSNYDDFLTQALRRKPEKNPRPLLCRWNEKVPKDEPIYDTKGEKPTVANPIVFHYFGRSDYPESLVLTEDDQYEFLTSLSRDGEELTNIRVNAAIGSTSLLFIGYTLRDRDFLLLFRTLASFIRQSTRTHVAVQLEPSAVPGIDPEHALEYLSSYFKCFNIEIYWGDSKQFAAELWARWKAFEQNPDD